MKLSKITAAIAATTIGATAQAATISGGGLDGVATDTAATHVSAIAIVAPTKVIDGLRSLQGFPAACDGNLTPLCAPSISSAELRAILDNSVANTAFIQGGGSNLGTATGLSGKSGGITEYAAAGVTDALNSFNGSGVVGGFPCGQGNPLSISTITANDAATLAAMNTTTAARFGFVHATELDNSVGFIKLDGVAPSLAALLSSNYNLVSNLNGAGTASTATVNTMTVGVATAGGGVASHAPVACSGLTTGSPILDVDGGSI